MANFNSIEDFASIITKGTFGMYGATLTEKRMNKYPCGCGRVKGTENPYEGRVFTLSVYQNIATGVNYYSVVKGECEREGIHFSDDEFASAFPKESTYCESVSDKLANIILAHENGQRYFRMYTGRKPTKVKYVTFLADDKGGLSVVAEGSALMRDILRYVPASSGSKKQEELGIKNVVCVKQPKVENVVFLMQGSNLYINPRFAYMGEDAIIGLCDMFKK